MRMLLVGFSRLDFFLLELTAELDGCKCFPSLTSLMDQFRSSAPPFHGNCRFATARHLFLSWATWKQSFPPPSISISLRSILILTFLYTKVYKVVTFFRVPHQNRVSIFFLLWVRFMPNPYHPPIILFDEEYKSWPPSLRSLYSTLFGPNIFRRNQMLNTISFSSWICVSRCLNPTVPRLLCSLRTKQLTTWHTASYHQLCATSKFRVYHPSITT